MIFLLLYLVVGVAVQILVHSAQGNRWMLEYLMDGMRRVFQDTDAKPWVRTVGVATIAFGFAAAATLGVIVWPLVVYRRLSA